MPNPDAIVLPEVNTVDVRIDPVQTFINSMVLISRSEELSGLNSWIYETAAALTEEQMAQHNLVVIGLHYIILPARFWKDTPSYLRHLKNSNPVTLRDQLLDFYIRYEPCDLDEDMPDADKDLLLADVDFFLDYLEKKFSRAKIDRDVESKAFELLNDPSEMQRQVASHLKFMWDEHFKDEWQRILPMLEDAVMAFEQIDFRNMSREEIAKYITGTDVDADYLDEVG
jgi:hypothetical protein